MSNIMIERLTPEQEGQMAAYRDKWIEIGLRTGETDFDTFDRYMPICYEKAGIPYPKNVVRVLSPLVGGLAAAVAEGILRNRRGAIHDAVDDAVDGAVHGAIRGAVHDAVDDAVDGAVHGAIRGAVHGAIHDAVDDAVHDAVGDAVRGAIRDAVHDAVHDAVDDAVGGAVSTAISIAAKAGAAISWHWWLGGQFWVGGWYWGVAFANFFFDVCKLKLSKDMMERAEAYRKVCESVNYIWPNRDFVIVCARPVRISRNALGQLHSDSNKAIEYPDGWGLYMLNGVRFDEALWKKVTSGSMPFAEILAIPDVDQRTQAMRFGDVEEFFRHTKAVTLDEHVKHDMDGNAIRYSLHEIPKGEVFRETAYYMRYDCPSTGKVYMQGVEKAKTVAEAMAWKVSNDFITITPGEWKLQVPLVHES